MLGWSDGEMLPGIELRGMVFIVRCLRGWKHDDAGLHFDKQECFRSKLDFGGVQQGC